MGSFRRKNITNNLLISTIITLQKEINLNGNVFDISFGKYHSGFLVDYNYDDVLDNIYLVVFINI